MSPFRMLLLASAVVIVGACSDTQSPSTPVDGEDLTLVLDESSMAAVEDENAPLRAGAAELGTGGRGKAERSGVTSEVVSCVSKGLRQLCTDIRSGRLRGADGDAIATKNVFRTRGQLKINGFLVAWTNNFGPVFIGDDIFARYRNLNIRVFRGDRICHSWKGGAAGQVCGVVR